MFVYDSKINLYTLSILSVSLSANRLRVLNFLDIISHKNISEILTTIGLPLANSLIYSLNFV